MGIGTITITLPANHINPQSYPDKWEPLTVRGLDLNGVSPLLLGFLSEEDKNTLTGQYRRILTHIVAKMPGHSWYYNQYHGTQYSGVAVHIYKINEYRLEDNNWIFSAEMPWDEEFQLPRKKKN